MQPAIDKLGARFVGRSDNHSPQKLHDERCVPGTKLSEVIVNRAPIFLHPGVGFSGIICLLWCTKCCKKSDEWDHRKYVCKAVAKWNCKWVVDTLCKIKTVHNFHRKI